MQQLDEIIYYLLDDLTKLVDPLGLEGTVNPNRQKLVRDQFILREVSLQYSVANNDYLTLISG